jgi:hypothetical protein
MKKHDHSPVILAMIIYERVRTRAAHDADFLMCDMTDSLTDEFGLSRATAYRYLRAAVDTLGIFYGSTKGRLEKLSERKSSGTFKASIQGFPNGRPGPRAGFTA